MVMDVVKMVFDVPSQIDVPPLKNYWKKKFFIFGKWLIEEDIIADIDQVIEDIEDIEDIKKFDEKKSFIFSK